jgi:acyl carrier protein
LVGGSQGREAASGVKSEIQNLKLHSPKVAMSRPIPLGVEVLVRKAAVDREFRAILLARRAEAAAEIDLVLEPAEAAMLAAVPAAQLEAIIDRTTVPQAHRRAFLGKAAAAMLAALGAMTPAAASAGIKGGVGVTGIRPTPVPDVPPPEIDPRRTMANEMTVCRIIAKVLDRDVAQVRRESRLATELGVAPEQFDAIHKALEEEFQITLSLATLKRLGMVDEVIRQVEATWEAQPAVIEMLARRSRVPGSAITPEKSLSGDLKLTAGQRETMRQELSTRLRARLDVASFRQQETVGDVIDMAASAVRQRPSQLPGRPGVPEPMPVGIRPDPPSIRGIQADLPPGGSFGIRP